MRISHLVGIFGLLTDMSYAVTLLYHNPVGLLGHNIRKHADELGCSSGTHPYDQELFGSISQNFEVEFFHTKAFRRLWENRLGMLGCGGVARLLGCEGVWL